MGFEDVNIVIVVFCLFLSETSLCYKGHGKCNILKGKVGFTGLYISFLTLAQNWMVGTSDFLKQF